MVPKRQGDPAGAADGGQGEQLGRRNRVTVSLLHSPPLAQHHVVARDQIPGKTTWLHSVSATSVPIRTRHGPRQLHSLPTLNPSILPAPRLHSLA